MKSLMFPYALIFGAAMATTAVAGPFGLPDHQPNGFRDTGCDAAAQKPITNAEGEVLYWNNSTCPDVGGNAGFGPVLAALEALYGTDDEAAPDEEAPGEVIALD